MEENRSRTEFLRGKREASSVKLREFMKLFKIYGFDGIYCFVEGEDSKYYSIRIRAKYYFIEPCFINSGGKQEVLRLYSTITSKKEYEGAKLLFFIDRDFDPLVNNSDIYETPIYAVENFYTSVACFSRILKMHFNLNEACDDYEICMNLFQRRKVEFHSAMLLLNSWIACQRELSNNGLTSRLYLKNSDLNDFVSIDLDQIKIKYDLDKLKIIFPSASDVKDTRLAEKIAEFKTVTAQKVFRGKYEIEFLRKFLEVIRTEIGKKNSAIFHEKHVISIQLSKTNILSELGDCADIPDCLVSYLERIIGNAANSTNVAHGA